MGKSKQEKQGKCNREPIVIWDETFYIGGSTGPTGPPGPTGGVGPTGPASSVTPVQTTLFNTGNSPVTVAILSSEVESINLGQFIGFSNSSNDVILNNVPFPNSPDVNNPSVLYNLNDFGYPSANYGFVNLIQANTNFLTLSFEAAIQSSLFDTAAELMLNVSFYLSESLLSNPEFLLIGTASARVLPNSNATVSGSTILNRAVPAGNRYMLVASLSSVPTTLNTAGTGNVVASIAASVFSNFYN